MLMLCWHKEWGRTVKKGKEEGVEKVSGSVERKNKMKKKCACACVYQKKAEILQP